MSAFVSIEVFYIFLLERVSESIIRQEDCHFFFYIMLSRKVIASNILAEMTMTCLFSFFFFLIFMLKNIMHAIIIFISVSMW
jgi:hypothetical protein